MNIVTLERHNRYGLSIQENINNTFTICNNSGDTFIAEFNADNDITLRHWNWKYDKGRSHFQGRFQSPDAMLKDVFQHGNRLMKKPKITRMDKLFAQIARG